MSVEGKTQMAQAVIATALGRLTLTEQADIIRWVNLTYVEARSHVVELTDRERRVLRLHARGLGHRAISEIVHCSYTTVPRDLRALQAKLGAESPEHLIVVAARAGLL